MADQQVLLVLAEVLVRGLADQPRVAANVCWAIHALAESTYEQAAQNNDDGVCRTLVVSILTFLLMAILHFYWLYIGCSYVYFVTILRTYCGKTPGYYRTTRCQ